MRSGMDLCTVSFEKKLKWQYFPEQQFPILKKQPGVSLDTEANQYQS